LISYDSRGAEATIQSKSGPAFVKMIDAPDPVPEHFTLRCTLRAREDTRFGLQFAQDSGEGFAALQFMPSIVRRATQFTHHGQKWIANLGDQIVEARLCKLKVTENGLEDIPFSKGSIEPPIAMSAPIATSFVNAEGRFAIDLQFTDGRLSRVLVNGFQLDLPDYAHVPLKCCVGLFVEGGSFHISPVETNPE
jgi:hypothetical protein